ncbi:hypothetical protein XELAEV_18039739mg [Xenopus laevis]|uniref:Helix-turn-helix domain-containing protein n=1 Tax=Xenopus laevis TaxID=8355 RepID=A0A974C8E2_XENLA|nr:hypothetical protein XELAEV_18039739mg [Xenopus laevis]
MTSPLCAAARRKYTALVRRRRQHLISPPWTFEQWPTFMSWFKEGHDYTDGLFASHCLAWWQYVNDVFLLWWGNLASMHAFQDAINEAHDDIKFTMNASLKTDRNQLLSYRSFHPAVVKKSIPTSQFTRVHRITNEPAQLEQDLDKMRGKISDRGYPQEILDTSLTKARENLRRTTNRNKTEDRQHLVFVGQYHSQSVKEGMFRCRGCAQCCFVLTGATFTNPTTNREYKIRGHYSCHTSFAVYMLVCPCNLVFVGEITQKVRNIFSQHRSTVNTRNSVLSVSKHCIKKGHTAEDLKFRVIQQVPQP